MPLKFRDLTGQVTGTTSTFSIAPDQYILGSTILTLNGAVQRPYIDYAETGNQSTLVTLFVPLLTDVLGVYYDLVPATPGPAPSGPPQPPLASNPGTVYDSLTATSSLRRTVPGLFMVSTSLSPAGFLLPSPIPTMSFQLSVAADILSFFLPLSGVPSVFPAPTGDWSYGGFPMPSFPDTVLQQCQVGDAGVKLVVQVQDQDGNPVNISAATGLTIKVLKPDGSASDLAASLYTNGADGAMSYVASANDLNQVGSYSIQGKVVLNGSAKSSAIGQFQVLPNVDNN